MADVRPHPHDVMVHAVLSDVAEATGFLRVICPPPLIQPLWQHGVQPDQGKGSPAERQRGVEAWHGPLTWPSYREAVIPRSRLA